MKINKSKRGITLVALIITIIVMLILVGVSIRIVITSGLFDSAKIAARKTDSAYRDESTIGSSVNIGGETYNSVEEYLQNQCEHTWGEWETVTEATCTEAGSKKRTCAKCKTVETETIDTVGHNYVDYICTICGAEDPNKPVLVVAGDYVKYDVSYTDVYMNSYNYGPTNGWRLLEATPNAAGTGYTEIKLISTGIPAKFCYDDDKTGIWWVTNSSTLTEFKNLLGGSSYNFYNSGAECPSLKAAAGFYYNFGNLPFTVTSSPSENNGGYTAITNSDQKSGTTVGTGAALFLTNKASGVRLLTLKEINEARGLGSDPDNTETITTAQDPNGIYKLDELTNVPGIGTISYNAGSYYLASPYPGGKGGVEALTHYAGTYARPRC